MLHNKKIDSEINKVVSHIVQNLLLKLDLIPQAFNKKILYDVWCGVKEGIYFKTNLCNYKISFGLSEANKKPFEISCWITLDYYNDKGIFFKEEINLDNIKLKNIK